MKKNIYNFCSLSSNQTLNKFKKNICRLWGRMMKKKTRKNGSAAILLKSGSLSKRSKKNV